MESNLEKLNKTLRSFLKHDFIYMRTIIDQAGSSVDSYNKGGYTPLHYAAQSGARDLEKVGKILIEEKGCSVYKRGKFGETPLFLACENGHEQFVNLLLQHDSLIIDSVTQYGESSVFVALKKGHKKVYKRLFNHVCSKLSKSSYFLSQYYLKYFLICDSIVEENSDGLEVLLDQVADDIDFESFQNESPLHFAVLLGNKNIVNILLKRGAKVNLKKRPGYRSVLHSAIEGRSCEVLQILMNHDIYMNDANYCNNMTPLMLTAESIRPELMRILLENQADVHMTDENGYTALHLACRSLPEETSSHDENHRLLECLSLLIEYNSDVNHLESEMSPLNLAICWAKFEHIQLLLKKNALPNIPTNDLTYPINMACQFGDAETVKLLLKYNADISVLDCENRTALHYAAQNLKSEPLKIILELGILNANTVDDNGNTAVHWASALHIEASCTKFLLLLQNGFDVNKKNTKGDYPYLDPFCDFDRDDENYPHKNCPLFAYFKKLRILGYKIHADILQGYPEDLLRDVMEGQNSECLEELDSLKKVTIGQYPKTTLFDVLLMNVEKVSKYAANKILRDIYVENNGDFANKFPNYGHLLNHHYRKGLRRRFGKNSAETTIKLFLGVTNKIPRICFEEINRYLSNKDLEILDFHQLISPWKKPILDINTLLEFV